jgi:hypothetical protein
LLTLKQEFTSLPRFVTISLFFLILLVFAVHGCKKEYSYEGGTLIQDSTITDPIILPDSANADNTIAFPRCEGCSNLHTTSSLFWSFKLRGADVCGIITNTVVSPEGTAMTFFGPSVCSVDSGLIITATFDQALKQASANLGASRASLEYYDNVTGIDILQSKQPNVFSLTIDQYTAQTGIATGRFSGTVVAKNGELVKVDDGKFKIRF